ncbi:hypothetical protein OIU79_009508 [Salix purpurea]|uniref:Uncharacterized protein n=1 Tax=Salix purpurea TaxID=77065 RepID=A0A9Q0YXA6_SALPP|nr:hypothetical protein OIU79_009508 [Salix purpurea]
MEENYLHQVIRSKDGRITDVSNYSLYLTIKICLSLYYSCSFIYSMSC